MSYTYIILGITVAISLASLNNSRLFERLLFSPYIVDKFKEYDRFITHGFIHVDYMHLFFNMFVLYMFGQNLEASFQFIYPTYGKILFLILYLVGIGVASIPAFLKRKDDIYYKSVGASGAVSAVLFSHIILMPTLPLYLFFIPIPIPSFIFGVLYMVYEYYQGSRSNTNIAHDAHLGGAIFGIIFTVVAIPNALSSFLQQVVGYFVD